MKHIETIAGIDIGSSAVRVVVGHHQDNGQMQLIGVGDTPSRGVAKGSIADLEEVVSSVSEALEKAERMVGSQLSRAVVAVNGIQSKVVQSQGVVAVSKPNGEVQQSDIDRAIEQSQAVASAPNFEILHVLPKYFNLDNQTNLKDPLGMTGIKLEAHTQIIFAQSAQVKFLNKCVYRTQLEVDGLVFGPLASAQAVLTKRQKDLGVAVVNMGASTTSVAVFEEGELLHAAVLPIGSDHITADVAIGLRIALDIAELVKIEQGHASATTVSKRDEVDISKYAASDMPRLLISRKHIAEIIEARLEELFRMVQGELRACDREKKLPAGVILTGGGSKLSGLVDFAKNTIELPVFLGSSEAVMTPIDKIKDAQYTTALGLLYFAEEGESGTFGKPMRLISRFLTPFVSRIPGMRRG
ncbi:MAG: cell division protein FtsA [Candidatus Komeilibacteria bacterium]|nr:cell division protein FtsA [Candidatus Komeilibacteria bacterium]